MTKRWLHADPTAHDTSRKRGEKRARQQYVHSRTYIRTLYAVGRIKASLPRSPVPSRPLKSVTLSLSPLFIHHSGRDIHSSPLSASDPDFFIPRARGEGKSGFAGGRRLMKEGRKERGAEYAECFLEMKHQETCRGGTKEEHQKIARLMTPHGAKKTTTPFFSLFSVPFIRKYGRFPVPFPGFIMPPPSERANEQYHVREMRK